MLDKQAGYLCLFILATLLLPIRGRPSPTPTFKWTSLFNGKDLTGWKHVGSGYMSVKDGLIETHGQNHWGLLYWTGGMVGNCVIRVVYRMSDDYDDSGVFVRIPSEPRDQLMPFYYGYQVQIDNHPERYGENEYYAHGSLYSFTKILAKAWKPPLEWNTMDIELAGPRTLVTLNGVKVTDYTEGEPVPAARTGDPRRGRRPVRGWFGLENDMEDQTKIVFFKEVSIRPLP